jgi:hypothetical protein
MGVEFDNQTLRDLRRSILYRARHYRDTYFRDGWGFDRRMLAHMLEHARDYRAREKADHALV